MAPCRDRREEVAGPGTVPGRLMCHVMRRDRTIARPAYDLSYALSVKRVTKS